MTLYTISYDLRANIPQIVKRCNRQHEFNRIKKKHNSQQKQYLKSRQWRFVFFFSPLVA